MFNRSCRVFLLVKFHHVAVFCTISSNNHMAVRVIWDVSPKLFSINFVIIPCINEGDFEIYKNNKGDISPISRISWLITFSLINTKQSNPGRQISGMITNQGMITKQQDDYNIINWHCVYNYTQKCDYKDKYPLRNYICQAHSKEVNILKL